MSNIDKQALRQLAGKATKGEWRAFIGAGGTCSIHTASDERFGDVVDWPGFDGKKNAKANAKFIAAANPATVLALVGELEAAEKRIAELTEERTISINEMSRIIQKEMKAKCEAQQHIAELEVQSKTALELRRAALADNAHLKLEMEIQESRTVTVKLPQRMSMDGGPYFTVHSRDDDEGDYYERDEVIDALRAAGIQVIEGDA